jgi:hypothetical protein
MHIEPRAAGDRGRPMGMGQFDICTSHVNLTIRTLMKRFTRLLLGFSARKVFCGKDLALLAQSTRSRRPGRRSASPSRSIRLVVMNMRA